MILATRDGQLKTCNGMLLVQKLQSDVRDSGLIVIQHQDDSHVMAGVLLATPDDGSIEGLLSYRPGDIIYFSQCLTLKEDMLVHWEDVLAFQSIA